MSDDELLMMRHPVSSAHKPLGIESFASQFSPFAALTGLDYMIYDVSRHTDERIELSDGLKDELDEKYVYISEHIKEHPHVCITYFVKDKTREGGAYKTVELCVKKVDVIDRVVIGIDGMRIAIDDISGIEIVG